MRLVPAAGATIPRPDRTPTAAAHPLRRRDCRRVRFTGHCGSPRGHAASRMCPLLCSLLKTPVQSRELHLTSPPTTPLAFPRVGLPRATRAPLI